MFGRKKQQIVVSIAPDGTIAAETFGMAGSECLDYVDVLEDLLDATAVHSEFTSAFHEKATVDQHESRHVLDQQ